MKKWLALLAAAGCALSLAVHAADAPAKAPTAQQQKMTTCNADAKTKALKGDERKAFMKECLSGGNAAPSACEGKAAEKKLAGAAKSSFVKKCEADAKTGAAPAAAPAAPAAAAAPAAK